MSTPPTTYAEGEDRVDVGARRHRGDGADEEVVMARQPRPPRRWRLPVALVAIGFAAALLVGGGWGIFASDAPEQADEPAAVAEDPAEVDEVTTAARFAESPSTPAEELVPTEPTDPAEPSEPAVAEDGPARPVRVTIPAIDVDAEIVDVGLLADGAMEVPDFGLAGWYELGPKPGEVGPAVIAAHVDSRDGPDVFFRLDELESGDEIIVEDADGGVETFAVTERELTPKDELPTERIWSSEDAAVLRLITCGGDFDRSARSYVSNTIVYADHAG